MASIGIYLHALRMSQPGASSERADLSCDLVQFVVVQLTTGPITSSRVRPAERHEHERIIALDAAAFGDRRHDLLAGLLRAGCAFVRVDAGVIEAFAIRRTFGRRALIGPIVATTPEAALELALASLVPGINRVDIAVDGPMLVAALGRHGLADAGTVVPMVRGAWPSLPGLHKIGKFAIASQAFG